MGAAVLAPAGEEEVNIWCVCASASWLGMCIDSTSSSNVLLASSLSARDGCCMQMEVGKMTSGAYFASATMPVIRLLCQALSDSLLLAYSHSCACSRMLSDTSPSGCKQCVKYLVAIEIMLWLCSAAGLQNSQVRARVHAVHITSCLQTWAPTGVQQHGPSPAQNLPYGAGAGGAGFVACFGHK